MTATEEQPMIHGLAGIAQSIHAMLTVITEMRAQRDRMDKAMLETLKLISRKH